MPDHSGYLAKLKRPKALVEAARFAVARGRRGQVSNLAAAAFTGFAALIAEESALNDRRVRGDANYMPAKHIAALAMMISLAS